MKTLVVPPDPGLLESMRSIGYTVESAVADVVDNSLAAGASQVDILVSAAGEFAISILDDGSGMSADEAVSAMRLAATRPSEERRPGDLGRFGLGLKTASLSQCRTLTVVTRKAGVFTALRWSLDHVLTTGEWSLIELSSEDISTLLGADLLLAGGSGTLVCWTDLDQLSMTEGDAQEDLDRVAQRVREHVALVFHRFITGDGVSRVRFSLNQGAIVAVDPFVSELSPATTPWESIAVGDEEVKLIAYTLPYLNRLTGTQRQKVLRLGGLRETQGFYVYRGGRLVIWGNWFRVMPRSEMAKLTRVRVDIPNTLDHLWALDVKKSKAEPPPVVKRRLSELAKTMVAPSEKVQKFQGRKVDSSDAIDYVWNVIVNGDEFRYEVNTEYPTVQAFADELSPDLQRQFSRVLAEVQSGFPIIDAHNRMSGDAVPAGADPDDELMERARESWALARKHGVSRDAFIHGLSFADPYCRIPDLATRLKQELAE